VDVGVSRNWPGTAARGPLLRATVSRQSATSPPPRTFARPLHLGAEYDPARVRDDRTAFLADPREGVEGLVLNGKRLRLIGSAEPKRRATGALAKLEDRLAWVRAVITTQNRPPLHEPPGRSASSSRCTERSALRAASSTAGRVPFEDRQALLPVPAVSTAGRVASSRRFVHVLLALPCCFYPASMQLAAQSVSALSSAASSL